METWTQGARGDSPSNVGAAHEDVKRGIERPIKTQKGQEKRIHIAEAGRSNGRFFFSLSRFKGLGFLEKKPPPWCSPTPLEACVQLDQCPSYPSKSQEEGERPELLERKRRRGPKTLTGVTKGVLLHSLSRPLFSPFSVGYLGGR